MDKRINVSAIEALLESLKGLEEAFLDLQQTLLAQQRRLESMSHVEFEPNKQPLKENRAAMVDMLHRMAINPSLVSGDKLKQTNPDQKI